MMRRIAIVFAILCVMAGMVWIARVQRMNRFVLPNGSRVELLGVAKARETFTTERGWQRWTRKFFPAIVQRWLPPTYSGSCGSGTNSLTVYVRHDLPIAGGYFWKRYSS